MPADDAKAQQLRHWNAVAEGWRTWFEWTERNFSPVTEWLRTIAAWTPGVRVLDVGSGAGYPAIAAARSVRPGGSVVGIDLSPTMVAVASEQAARAGLDNVQFREMDAEDLQFRADSFDSVTTVTGLMFCPNAARALTETHRVLKSHGRLAVVVWDAVEKSPFFSVIHKVAAPLLSLSSPVSGAAGPFRFAPAGAIGSLLEKAGFSNVEVTTRVMTFELESPAQYCRIFGDVAWKNRMDALSTEQFAGFEAAVAAATQPYIEGGRLRLEAAAICASGLK